MLVLIRTQI